MKKPLWKLIGWQPGRPAWGAATVAGLGCALPLLLGLFSGHTGFLWATVGAFQAAKANPLHRLGMLRMLLLIGLGAGSAGLGFWSATHPLISLGLFAFYGLLLAWLQRYGSEAGKLGIGLAICLCLGQGQHGIGDFNNPQAIAALFALGACGSPCWPSGYAACMACACGHTCLECSAWSKYCVVARGVRQSVNGVCTHWLTCWPLRPAA